MKKSLRQIVLLVILALSVGSIAALGQSASTSRPELVLEIGHVNTVTALAWSPDGKTVASGSKDQSAKLWDAHTGALLFSLTTHSGTILAVAFSPDSRTLYTASGDGSVRAWNVASGSLVGNVRGPAEHLTAAAISGTDSQVLVASAAVDQPITLWRDDPLLSGDYQLIASLKGHPKTVHALAFAADGKLLASGSDEGTVKYWDTEDGSLQRTLRGHAMTINSVAFSTDSTFLADASDDGITQIWDLDTGKDLHALQMNRPGDGIAAVAFSPDGHTVVTGGDGGPQGNEFLMLWNATTEKQTAVLNGHERMVTAAAFSPDGKMLVTGSRDDTVRFWSVATARQTHLAGSLQTIPCLAYSPDGKTLVGGSADGAVRLWNAKTGELAQVLFGHAGSVTALAYAPDGKTLASGGKDQTVRLWNAVTGQPIRTLKATGPVNTLAFSPDGATLAAGSGADSYDGALQVWNISTGMLKYTGNSGSLAMVHSVAWSPDGKRIATGSGVGGVGEVRIWNALTGEVQLQEFDHAVHSVAYSADGKILVAGSIPLDDQDNPTGDDLKVWNARTLALQQTLTVSTAEGGINAVAILLDGKTVVAGSRDDQIRLWNAKTGEALQTLTGHLGQVLAVAAAPDGKTFASSGQDNTIRIWSVASGHLLGTLVPLPAADSAKDSGSWLTVTPDGYYDASPSAPRYIEWRVGPDLFPVAAYEQTLHRPDLLRKALRDEVITETPDAQKFAGGQAVPPAITFTAPQDGQSVKGDTVTVDLDITDIGPVSHVEILANGRPVGAKTLQIGSKPLVVGAKPLTVGAKPLTVGAKPLLVGAKPLTVGAKPIPTGHTLLQQFQIETPLPPGESDVTLTALATDTAGLQAREEIHLTHPSASGAIGNLYVLSVGVSRYRNPNFNLKYAARDADAFADLWKRQEGGLYKQVTITRLLDDQATSTNVRAALFKLVESATDADTVVLFFSGHGVQVNDTDYYFATQEIDPLTASSIDASALPWTALQTTLASVHAKRVLMFLDACHSGSALGSQQASSERMGELLVKRAGVMVFAGCRSTEYSYEVDSLQHGAFTAALIEGLGEGKADLAIGGPPDGVITAEELLAYLRARVPHLSENRQTPSCPLLRDFGEAYPIARTH